MRLEEARLFHVMGDTSLAIKSAKELVESQFRDDGTIDNKRNICRGLH